MPIIANNFIVNGEKQEQSAPVETQVPLVPLEKVSMVARTRYDKEHGILVVDGKQMKVSKQSQYILDMLTLDNQ